MSIHSGLVSVQELFRIEFLNVANENMVPALFGVIGTIFGAGVGGFATYKSVGRQISNDKLMLIEERKVIHREEALRILGRLRLEFRRLRIQIPNPSVGFPASSEYVDKLESAHKVMDEALNIYLLLDSFSRSVWKEMTDLLQTYSVLKVSDKSGVEFNRIECDVEHYIDYVAKFLRNLETENELTFRVRPHLLRKDAESWVFPEIDLHI